MPEAPASKQIQDSEHPDYKNLAARWDKFRKVFEGGDAFKIEYLEKFSLREGETDFQNRRDMTPVPSHAKAAIIDIKNAIFQRLVDISRTGGPTSWQNTVDGRENGVDFAGNSMTGYIGRMVLPELLSMGKVGVYIDKPRIETGMSMADTKGIRPYIYKYNTEDIRSWSFDDQNRLTAVLLRNHEEVRDQFGLVTELKAGYKLLNLEKGLVRVRTFLEDSALELPEEDIILNLTEIPFVIFELSQSLLEDVADHQIALLNMGSSDVNYAIKSNYPFYTEQISPLSHLPNIKQPGDDASSTESGTASTTEIKVGVTQGRGYPKGLERPGFIHPSAEPLLASMKKQADLREEIRLLINLSLTNIEPRRASAESKALDEHSLEAGLSYIGLELEYGERQIAHIWSLYERDADPTINYPSNYSLRSEQDRRQEAKELTALQDAVPSSTYKKTLAKEIAKITVSHSLDDEAINTINKEIDDSPVTQIDSKTIIADHKEGFVSTETASKLRGYPEGEAKKAEEDHAKRMAKMVDQQGDSEASSDQKVDKTKRGEQDALTDKEKVRDE